MAPKEAVIDVVSDEMATARELEFAGDSDGELVRIEEYDDEISEMWDVLSDISNRLPPKLPSRAWHFKADAFLYRLESIKATQRTDVFDIAYCRKHYKLLRDEGIKLLREVDAEEHDDSSAETLVMGQVPAPAASSAASSSSAPAADPKELKKRPASSPIGPLWRYSSTREPPRRTKTKCLAHHGPVTEL